MLRNIFAAIVFGDLPNGSQEQLEGCEPLLAVHNLHFGRYTDLCGFSDRRQDKRPQVVLKLARIFKNLNCFRFYILPKRN